jgi:hypothetical protein
LWYNYRVRTSIRIASVVLLLTMAGGGVSTAICEIACLNGAPASRTRQFVSPAPSSHGCHDSVSQAPAGSDRVAATAHAECHGNATAPFALTANSIRDSLDSGELPLWALQDPATPVSVPGLREHTLPDLRRAPIAPLRI